MANSCMTPRVGYSVPLNLSYLYLLSYLSILVVCLRAPLGCPSHTIICIPILLTLILFSPVCHYWYLLAVTPSLSGCVLFSPQLDQSTPKSFFKKIWVFEIICAAGLGHLRGTGCAPHPLSPPVCLTQIPRIGTVSQGR